ncbi:MAG: GIY-YIG nuclease family protein [Anaerolineae bacterium]|nr:GIY-YIG nuclease family protein [Anaerolineae bacterium]
MADQAERLPAARGTYILLLNLPAPLPLIVGRLGQVLLPAGWHLYVGSAHGAGGLRARVGRHLRYEKRLHWHIDALTTIMPVKWVWYVESPDRAECEWAHVLLALPEAAVPVQGFGASDCNCPTHLICVRDVAAAYQALIRHTGGLLVVL